MDKQELTTRIMAEPEFEVILRTGETIARQLVAAGDYSIGRSTLCALVAENPELEEEHAFVSVSIGGVRVKPCSVQSEVRIGEARVQREQELALPACFSLRNTHVEISEVRSGRTAVPISSNPKSARIEAEHYEIYGEIAAGGMGRVLDAEDLKLGRPVAMKVLHEREDVDLDLEMRFVQEAEIMGWLEHPNIVPIHDFGKDAKGRPFYTMKRVQGETLQAVLNKLKAGDAETIQDWPLNNLLNVFLKVCDAVAFAHSKGVIHRDLKPENVMIGDFGEVLVMDWGLARMLTDEADELLPKSAEEQGHDLPGVTMDGAVIGTPQYMSPEQACGHVDAIDTRSDIYSLGAILYVLLTLRAPISGESVEAVLEQVRDNRIVPPAELEVGPLPHCPSGKIPAPVSAIVLRAMAGEPDRRYPSAEALATDIKAHQGGFATSVEEPGVLKLLTLFYRRNRFAVSAAAISSIAILAALAVSLSMYFRENAARKTAQAEAEKSAQVARFLNDTLASAGPSAAMGRDTALMRDILDQTTIRIGEELRHQPRITAELSRIIGNVYTELREFEPALEQLANAVALQRQLNPKPNPDLAGSLLDLAAALELAGRIREAEPPAREAFDMWQILTGPDSPETADAGAMMSWLLIRNGRAKDGEQLARNAMETWRRFPGDPRITEAPNTLATIFLRTDRPEDARQIFEEELRVLRRVHGSEHPLIANCLDNYSTALLRLGRDQEAEKLLLDGIEMGRKFYGDRNPDEDHMLAALARVAGKRGDLESQLKYARECRATGARVYPVGHRYWRESQGVYLQVLLDQIEIHFDDVLAESAGKQSRQFSLQQADTLLNEYRDAKDLKSLKQPHHEWVELLAAGVAGLANPSSTNAGEFRKLCVAIGNSSDKSETGQARRQAAKRFLAAMQRMGSRNADERDR